MAAPYVTQAQQQDTTASFNYLFRVYVDDDFINLRGKGTDEAYTAGINLSLFYRKQHPSRFFIDRWMPKAGNNADNVFGWGINQLMYTPRDIDKVPPDKNDYRYAGALTAVHSLNSFNADKKYSLQTEVVAGVMGPPSFARQTQTFFHHVIGYRLPAGWDYQLPVDALLNINVKAEKMLLAYKNVAELTIGARAAAGTMEDGLTVFAGLRAGIMQPYFSGFLNQYSTNKRKQRFQLYAFVRPGAEVLGYYALINGGLFNNTPGYYNEKDTHHPDNRKLVAHLDGGIVLAGRKFALSVTQKMSTSLFKYVRAHAVGNISLYIVW